MDKIYLFLYVTNITSILYDKMMTITFKFTSFFKHDDQIVKKEMKATLTNG